MIPLMHRLPAHSKLQCNAPQQHFSFHRPRHVPPMLQCHAEYPQQGQVQHTPETTPQAPSSAEIPSFDEAPASTPVPRRKPLKKRSKSSLAMASASGAGRAPPLSETQLQPQQAPSPVQATPSSQDLWQGPRDLVFRHSVEGSNGSSLDDASWDDEDWVQPRRPAGNCDRGERGGGDHTCIIPKPIMILSDCTGESAARTVKAALSQFEACFDTTAPASIVVTRFLEDEQRAFQMVEQAAKQDALLVYTLVDRKVLTAVQTACKLFNVRHVDLWSNLLVRWGSWFASLQQRWQGSCVFVERCAGEVALCSPGLHFCNNADRDLVHLWGNSLVRLRCVLAGLISASILCVCYANLWSDVLIRLRRVLLVCICETLLTGALCTCGAICW
ncbi:hypothetical protein DUNSADRAFT_595 [Dunaliella salina]|uniref:Uncharacterized protein n=1 Tax=Dunaliella salina TaxID=3046 RepID=A0ABQ7GY44_DUNSA|nr:hypothetical protein DUNSADRAFT_595 [Dunaliella salina]|eukprot:KAF5839524.1 hypothetical protein DUNSADRAFT_595 [Dunaliella salina]